MGLGGAFLTGDLFNLFVFFEVTLAASYGLLLHGSGAFRVRSGLHYIAINLAASLLFLIGVSLIYGVTGTLNMADLALRIPEVPDDDRVLLQAGAAILGVAFLVKAGMWPLGFWLPSAYMAAAAPVAAIFVVLTKVGVYVLLRLSLLLFGSPAGELTGFGGMRCLRAVWRHSPSRPSGVLASQAMGRLAGYQRPDFLGDVARRRRHGRRRGRVRSPVLSRQLDLERSAASVHADRARGARTRARSRPARRHHGSLWRGAMTRPRNPRTKRSASSCLERSPFSASAFGCVALLLAGLPPLVRVRRQVRHADRHAEPGRTGERDRDPGAHLAAGRAGHSVRPGGTGRDDARPASGPSGRRSRQSFRAFW